MRTAAALRVPAAVAAAVLAAAAVAGPAADPRSPGPFLPGMTTEAIPVGAGASRIVDVHFPRSDGTVDPAAGLCPVVVFGHGFTRDRTRYRDLAEHLAGRGYVVLVADYRCGLASGCDHDANAAEMSALVDWILARDADPASIFLGRIDTAAVGSSGHSAGGLQAILTAARDPRVTACAVMDPVDFEGLGAAALATLAVPLAITYSEPGLCNLQGSSARLLDAAGPPVRGVRIVGATHCDPEIDADPLGCTLACGAWTAEHHADYVGLVTGWFERFLHRDAAYAPWTTGSWMGDRVAAGTLVYDADLTPPAPSVVRVDTTAGVRIARAAPAWRSLVDHWVVERSGRDSPAWTRVGTDLAADTVEWEDPAPPAGATVRYRIVDVATDFTAAYPSAPSTEVEVAVPGSRPPRRLVGRP